VARNSRTTWHFLALASVFLPLTLARSADASGTRGGTRLSQKSYALERYRNSASSKRSPITARVALSASDVSCDRSTVLGRKIPNTTFLLCFNLTFQHWFGRHTASIGLIDPFGSVFDGAKETKTSSGGVKWRWWTQIAGTDAYYRPGTWNLRIRIDGRQIKQLQLELTEVPTPTATPTQPSPVATATSTHTNTPTVTPTQEVTETATTSPTATPTSTPTSAPVLIDQPTSTSAPMPTLTPAPVGHSIVVGASVSNPNPPRYSYVTVYGRITDNGVGVSGVPMNTTWYYRTTTSYCSGVTDGSGFASCTRYISSATSGYFVSISVTFSYQGQLYTAQTGFTPQ
jgi:hypothetical protein